ncbi:4-diphosphocytidyl-2-C-methyl-D-erythritol kinase [Motilibacter peucedani]|uniref:4-diphosphocytidyl-2-C-methyl-D-erythritol kinase n=1 Tax=Motilibacter peucedani TaxID=598650 RepID=A0A420XL80_9ACTN|nr:4-(cytidine 5'-diphospho)-2-C-methyl-D-erythritol kinase [Motilibacter peucedani]RKS68597.1 4-diphosphocytidyl-2-C-methyl-D-erythritol kinase [Motilibacter peucedani]
MGHVAVRVPAKVNLQLAVGPLRADGYHDLATVFHAVSLFDEVHAEDCPALEVVTTGPQADAVPGGADNLAGRAATLLAARAGRAPEVRLTIRKDIPVAGGMAGGSADAAAALVACDALWGLDLGREALAGLAAELGSDVPFALLGGTAVGLGRGERLTPALARGGFTWVFALAHQGLATPQVFAECDRQRAGTAVPEAAVSEPLMAALRAGDPVALGRALGNDLQPAALALRPELGALLELGRAHGALGAVLSGSGPTCAFLVESRDAGLALGDVLLASGDVRDVRHAHGPVHGARTITPRVED